MTFNPPPYPQQPYQQGPYQPPPFQPPKKPNPLPYIIGGFSVLLVLGIALAVNDDDRRSDERDAAAATSASSTPPYTPPATPPTQFSATRPTTTQPPPPSRDPNQPPYPVHTQCQPAADGYVTIINDAFADSNLQLGETFEVSASHDITYVGGNIYEGDRKVSSADVWAVQHGVMFSLSSDARRRTLLPDGRDLLDASAGDDYGTMLQDCIGNATWELNRTGGR